MVLEGGVVNWGWREASRMKWIECLGIEVMAALRGDGGLPVVLWEAGNSFWEWRKSDVVDRLLFVRELEGWELESGRGLAFAGVLYSEKTFWVSVCEIG